MSQIPEKFWIMIIAFLQLKKSGQIVLHVHEGNVMKLDVTEAIRV